MENFIFCAVYKMVKINFLAEFLQDFLKLLVSYPKFYVACQLERKLVQFLSMITKFTLSCGKGKV